jgi:hypothetical protein
VASRGAKISGPVMIFDEGIGPATTPMYVSPAAVLVPTAKRKSDHDINKANFFSEMKHADFFIILHG